MDFRFTKHIMVKNHLSALHIYAKASTWIHYVFKYHHMKYKETNFTCVFHFYLH